MSHDTHEVVWSAVLERQGLVAGLSSSLIGSTMAFINEPKLETLHSVSYGARRAPRTNRKRCVKCGAMERGKFGRTNVSPRSGICTKCLGFDWRFNRKRAGGYRNGSE